MSSTTSAAASASTALPSRASFSMLMTAPRDLAITAVAAANSSAMLLDGPALEARAEAGAGLAARAGGAGATAAGGGGGGVGAAGRGSEGDALATSMPLEMSIQTASTVESSKAFRSPGSCSRNLLFQNGCESQGPSSPCRNIPRRASLVWIFFSMGAPSMRTGP